MSISKPGREAHIRAAALQDPRGAGRARICARGFELDHRPAVLQDMIGARALGDPVGHLLADDLVLIGREAFDVGMHQRDGLDGDLRLIEELQFLATLGAILLSRASSMGRDTLAFLDGGAGAGNASPRCI